MLRDILDPDYGTNWFTRFLRRVARLVVRIVLGTIGLTVLAAAVLWVLQLTGVLDDPWGGVQQLWSFVTGGGLVNAVGSLLAAAVLAWFVLEVLLGDDHRGRRLKDRNGDGYVDARDFR